MSVSKVDHRSANSNSTQAIQTREKKQLNRNHEAEMNKLKNSMRAETEQLRSEHRLQVIAEKDRQADTLTRLREDLDRTQKNLTEQKEFLIDKSQRDLSKHLENQNTKFETSEKHFNEKVDHQKLRQNDVLHKADINFNEEQSSKLLAQKDALATLDDKTKQDLQERAKQVQARSMHENKVGEELVRNLKLEKHKQFQDEDQKWKQKMQSQNVTNQLEFQRQDKQWKASIQNENKNHQDLYAKTLEQHKAEFSEREKLFFRENEKIKSEASKQLTHVMNKTADPFYQNNNIKPEIVDLGDSYKLTINVADHEKDQYLLSGHDRTLTLSFSRNFQHDIKQPDNVSKTRRVESYSHSFFVSEIVKPNSVSKNYEDGKLIFNIKKA
jgi:HSP20 family molecular chaperone IbpA